MIKLVRDGIKAILGKFVDIEVENSIKRNDVDVIDEAQLQNHLQNDVHTQPQPPATHTHNHSALNEIGTNTHTDIDTHIANALIHFTEGSINHSNIQNAGTNTHSTIDSHLADNITNRKHMTDAQNDAFDNAINPSSTNRVILANDLDSGYAESEGESQNLGTTYQNKLVYDFIPKSSGNYLVMWSAEMTGTPKDKNIMAKLQMGADTTISEVGFRTSEFNSPGGYYCNVGGMKVVNLTGTTTFRIQYRAVDIGTSTTIRCARLFIRRV